MSMLNLYAKPGYRMGPWKRIKWWFRRAKYARQRARWGFSEYDARDFEAYHAELVSKMMIYLAEHHRSQPPEKTAEQWESILYKIGELFAFWNKELPSPAYEAYCNAKERFKRPDGSMTTEMPRELVDAWYQEEREKDALKKEKLKEGFELLLKYYSQLWD